MDIAIAAIQGTTVLDRNLAALGAASPAAAAAIAGAVPREDLVWIDTPSGRPSATATDWTSVGVVTRALASRRDPVQEAQRLTQRVNVLDTPMVIVVGFALGYHVEQLAAKVDRHGVIVVFEPDVALLRAVLDRIDCSEWISRTNLLLLTEADDEGAMANSLRGLDAVIAMGVHVLEHPPSQARLGESAGGLGARFVQRFTRIVKAARTTVVTTMVQTEGALRNLTQNADLYATSRGVDDLAGRARGRPAIVVSAGPSLRRNIDLLARPGVRDRFVIIAVQTVLKQLLARGIRPHFVTALDFHQISTRFYEGLTAEDVAGITLVVEPKVNPAVPLAFPGAIRCVGDTQLDRLLGPDFTRSMGSLPPGATVAHLAYYLARHLACDPVVLVGQDLGFTDGQYYAAGAAIHDTWAGELNEFTSVEMLEWQRIVRMRGQLRAETDVLGRAIYTDEQMSTYLVQFQRDFKADADRGLLTIDATEGGVAKASTVARPLAQVLDEVGHDLLPLDLPMPPPLDPDERRRTLARVAARIREVRQGVWNVARDCRRTRALLEEMLEHQEDQGRVNRLITQVEAVRDRVTRIQPAFALVETLNQTGGFNRQKADRRIHLGRRDGELSPVQVQREQIQRDITNVTWMGDAADAMGEILDESVGACEGRPKRTRDPSREEDRIALAPAGAPAGPVTGARVRAVVTVDPAFSGLGVPRDLSQPVLGTRNALQLTLARLARCRRLAGITVIATDEPAARRLADDLPDGPPIEFRQAQSSEPGWPHAVARAGRLWSSHGWRGGLGNLTCYDESLWPGATLAAIDASGDHAALVVSADWSMVDPALCDALIERYAEAPAAHRLTFSQAAPGLAGCIADRAMVAQIAERRATVGSFASIGGVLGFVPTAPAPDLIARPMCVPVPVPVRDALHRCTLDSPARAVAIIGALADAGLDPLLADAAAIAGAVSERFARPDQDRPRDIVLRVIDARARLDPGVVTPLLRQLGPWAALSTVTIAGESALAGGRGPDALDHPDLSRIIAAARAGGIGAIHVRTTLRSDPGAIDALVGAAPEVISADLVADDAATYAAITGGDDFARVRAGLQRLLTTRPPAGSAGVPIPWVVPRLTRRDAVYGQIEAFYDYWTLMAGWAVLDPLPAPVAGERIEPLPLPPLAARRRALARVVIGPDGTPQA